MKYQSPRSILSGLLPAVMLSLSGNTFAEFITGSNFVRDTDSGLDWLLLSETQGYSYAQVAAQLSAGGLYEGWSFASEGQLASFFDNAGGSGEYPGLPELLPDGSIIEPDYGNMETIYVLWDVYPDEYGMAGFWWGNTVAGGAGAWIGSMQGDRVTTDIFGQNTVYAGHIVLNYSTIDVDISAPAMGSALVRVSPVPVPAALWLFGSGVLMLSGLARSKR